MFNDIKWLSAVHEHNIFLPVLLKLIDNLASSRENL